MLTVLWGNRKQEGFMEGMMCAISERKVMKEGYRKTTAKKKM